MWKVGKNLLPTLSHSVRPLEGECSGPGAENIGGVRASVIGGGSSRRDGVGADYFRHLIIGSISLDDA